jgi:cob(I)alamin adenosyltransferase
MSFPVFRKWDHSEDQIQKHLPKFNGLHTRLELSKDKILEQGLVQVYSTDAMLMNYAPFGLALRAAGQNFRSLIVNFVSYDLMEGVRTACEILKPNIVIVQIDGNRTSTHPGMLDTGYEKRISNFQRIKEAVFSGVFDIVILNGVGRAFDQGIVSSHDIITLMSEKPDSVELVLSGLKATAEMIEKADLVTEMLVHKHEPSITIGNCPEGRGAIEIVTGNGKGKTTYCLGKAMLTSCIGVATLILQFIKSPQLYGEIMAIEKLPHLEIRTMGKGFLIRHSPYQELELKHKLVAQQAWELWVRLSHAQDYGLLVLDEINIATSYGLINVDRIREVLFLRPQNFNSLLSGRNAHPIVVEACTTHIEMKEIKHPFKAGVKARKGIEF